MNTSTMLFHSHHRDAAVADAHSIFTLTPLFDEGSNTNLHYYACDPPDSAECACISKAHLDYQQVLSRDEGDTFKMAGHKQFDMPVLVLNM